MLTIEQIMEIIPHRPPFLLVDRVLELEAGARAVGLKQVTVNEPFFAGHFPGKPIMPGVLQVEALAQVGAIALLSHPDYAGKLAVFAGIDNVRFRRMIVPGDTLRIEVSLDKLRRSIGKGKGSITVDGDLALEGEFLFGLTDRT